MGQIFTIQMLELVLAAQLLELIVLLELVKLVVVPVTVHIKLVHDSGCKCFNAHLSMTFQHITELVQRLVRNSQQLVKVETLPVWINLLDEVTNQDGLPLTETSLMQERKMQEQHSHYQICSLNVTITRISGVPQKNRIFEFLKFISFCSREFPVVHTTKISQSYLRLIISFFLRKSFYSKTVHPSIILF